MDFKKVWPLVFLTIVCTWSSMGASKTDSYFYKNAIFKDGIKSVQLFREGNVLSDPVYELGSDVQLILKFDDLADDVKNFSYTVIHCDASWNESYIRQNEYLSGFPDNLVSDYASSYNTTVKYVNYQLHIPNEDCTPKVSGNYALVVFEDGNRENLVLTKRFYVVDPKARIDALVKKATFDSYNGEDQEVDFNVYLGHLRVLNPSEDIKVILMQNRRDDNAIRNLVPSFIRESELDYDYSKENVFSGGNEFRYFDIRTVRHNGENVAETKFIRPYYHITVAPEGMRAGQGYKTYKEMNGSYVVESQDRVTDNDTECDYMYVHFFLPLGTELVGGSVHVFGALTDWNVDNTNAMTWNPDRGGYELVMLLKQGYYNYEYAYVPENGKKIDTVNMEGTHFITENDYQIFVYYHDQSARYDRLVGFLTINSTLRK